jgi:hypothetical protein
VLLNETTSGLARGLSNLDNVVVHEHGRFLQSSRMSRPSYRAEVEPNCEPEMALIAPRPPIMP